MGALVNNKAINLLFSFKGRVPRKTYWLYIIACITAGLFPFLSFVNMDREERELYIAGGDFGFRYSFGGSSTTD